jgi:hypothetical protein
MKEIAKMRLGVLRGLKNVRLLLDRMERKIKSRDPLAVQEAYMFLKTLVVMLDSGELSPDAVALNLELAQLLQEDK